MRKVIVGNDKVFIGRLGDDDVREFAFDLSEYTSCMDGEFSVSCLFVLPSKSDSEAYAIAIDHYRLEGNQLIWIPTNAECSETGWGKFEAILYNNDQQVATLIWRVQIGKSLVGDEEPPTGWENYILAVEKLVDEIENMTVSASVDANVGTPSVTVETSGGQGEPFSIDFEFHNLKGGQGEQGVGIASISIAEKSASGLDVVYTLTATKTDGTTTASDFTVRNGNGIASAVLNDDYTLTLYFDDGTHYTTPSIRGEQGEQGIQGVGVSTITATKTSTVGLVDTYTMTITLTNGNTQTVQFTVTNGSNVELSDDDPLMDGTADSGTSVDASRSDHVHPHDVSLLPTDSVNGNPISISDGFPVNAKGLSVALEPIQDLHGYESPWPAGGGKNLCHIDDFSSTIVSDITISASNNILNINGTTNAVISAAATVWNAIKFHAETSGRYTISVKTAFPTGVSIGYYDSDNVFHNPNTSLDAGDYTVGIYIPNGTAFNNFSTEIQVEAGSTATAYAPYSNICPITGRDEVSVTRTDGDGQQSISLTIPLGQTVYGGTVDVTNGVLTVTHAIVDLGTRTWNYIAPTTSIPYGTFYNTIVGKKNGQLNLMCDSYPTEAGFNHDYAMQGNSGANTVYLQNSSFNGDAAALKTSLNGVMLCYELATPIAVTLTPQDLMILLGDNVITSDGTITLTYKCEIQKYIQKLIASLV